MLQIWVYWSDRKECTKPMNSDAQGEEIAYIHLSPMKAYRMADYAQKLIDDPKDTNIYGVDTGAGENRGLIAIGREMGRVFVFLAKVDVNGNYISQQKFRFNHNYHYGLQISNLDNLQFQKQFDENAELIQLHDLLADYARYTNGAAGFAVHDVARYESAKLNNLVRSIADKVGAEVPGSRRQYTGNGASNSYFSGNGNSSQSNNNSQSSGGYSSRYTSMGSADDLESELLGE